MYNPKAYALGANRSCIRDLFEYGQNGEFVGRHGTPKEVSEFVAVDIGLISPNTSALNLTLFQTLTFQFV